MATKWIPPLPNGWEARYDHNQKAYFFINHIHKTTQWDDPRFHQKAPPAPPQPQHNTAAVAAASLVARPENQRGKFEAIGLREFSSLGRTGYNTQESSLTSEQNKAVVDRLKAEFPHAARELIGDMLRLCHNNERETREQLNDLGFESSRTSSPGPGSAQTSPQHLQQDSSPNHLSPHKKKSKRKSRSQQEEEAVMMSGTHPVSPARPQVSEADKKRVHNQLKGLFSKTDPDVLRLALEQCNYDLEQTKLLLHAFEESNRGDGARNASAASGHAASVGNSTSSVRPFSPPISASLEPAGLEDAAENRAQVLGSTQQNSYRPGHRPASKSHTTSTGGKTSAVTHAGGVSFVKIGSSSVKQVPSSATAAVPPGHAARKQAASVPCSQTARAKQVTRMSEHLLNTTSDLLTHLATTASCCVKDELQAEDRSPNSVTGQDSQSLPAPALANSDAVAKPAVVTSQPTAKDKSKAISQFRSEVSGPDASLRKGPDGTLLISDYTQASGPNTGLRSGPDPSRLTGPKGGVGPDLTLRCGPQSSLLHNPRKNDQHPLVGPSRGVLVSNI